MKRVAVTLVAIIGIFSLAFIKPIFKENVEVVFCLDISQSTDGLSQNFCGQIWEVINELSNQNKSVQLGVVLYGQPKYGESNNYVKVLSNFTEDYDHVAHELLSIDDISGSVGTYPHKALETTLNFFNWSENAVEKQVYLIGNGDISGLQRSFKQLTAKSAKNGIQVNTIYLDPNNGKNNHLGWMDVAKLGKGKYHKVRLKRSVDENITYTEDMLLDVGELLNHTYVPYSSEGKERVQMLHNVDQFIKSKTSKERTNRIRFKTGGLFQGKNKDWDLVEYIVDPSFDFSSLDRNQLPEEYQNLTDEMLLVRVIDKKDEREQIIEIVNMLSKKLEDKYVQEIIQKRQLKGNELSKAILSSFYTVNTQE